jgi:hypothetical protein
MNDQSLSAPQDWQWEVVEENQEPIAQREMPVATVTRGLARTAARASEAALGVPGDIASSLLSLGNLAYNKATGEQSPLGNVSDYLPTSKNIKEYGTKTIEKALLPKDYLEPQGEGEQLADNIISDFSSIIMPVGGALGLAGKGGKIAKGAVKSAAISSGLGNIAGFLTKNITGNEGAAEGVKAGTMLLTSLVGSPRMINKAQELYEKAKGLVPETAQVTTKPIGDALNKIDKLLVGQKENRGGKALQSFLESEAHKIANTSSASVDDIIRFKQGFNKYLRENPSLRDVGDATKQLREGINHTIDAYGKTNPSFLNAYRSADQLYSEALKSNKLQDFIASSTKKIASKGLKTKGVLQLLGLGSYAAKALPALGAASVAGAVTYPIAEIYKRIPGLLEKPAVRRYYAQTLKQAAKGSRPGVIKAVIGLDKAIEKEERDTETNWQWEVID